MNRPCVLVTGASRGIGYAAAALFADRGYRVLATATLPQSVPQGEDRFEWFFADFTDEKSTEQFFLDIEKAGRIDALVNNAGINIIKPVADVTKEDFDCLYDINIKIPYFLIQKIVKLMGDGGRIVNIASIWSLISKEKRTLYSSAKSALAGLTRALAVELADRNILVNTVSPGFTRTELTAKSLSKEEAASLTERIPLKRMAETAEIAELICFLADEKNSYITGQNIAIDGGFTLV